MIMADRQSIAKQTIVRTLYIQKGASALDWAYLMSLTMLSGIC